MNNINEIKILYTKDLAKIFNTARRNFNIALQKNPEGFPPRFILPGSKRMMWLEKDVIEWVNNCRTNKTAEGE
jgi:predicted DNA-binding transcriptional regulator AlpA